MRKSVAVLVMLFAVAAFATAQEEAPKVDIFAGYSMFHFDDRGLEDDLNAAFPGCCSFTKVMHGWEGSAQFNLNKTFGIVADFSGHYGTPIEIIGGNSVDATMYNVLFGPQVNYRSRRVNAYAHTLLGFNRVKVESIPAPVNNPEFTESGFAWAIGGGFDVNVTKSVGVRLGQFDYILTTHDFGLPGSVGHQNNLRYSAGIVFRLGNK